MAKRDKRLAKMRQNPKSVSFDDLQKVLEDHGFQLVRIKGSHHVFESTEYDKRLVVPKRNPVKAGYVKDAIRIIDKISEGQTDD